LSAVRATGFVAFQFRKENNQEHEKILPTFFSSLLKYRPFVLYFVPWCMFCLINFMTEPIVQKLFDSQANFYSISIILESVFTAISAVSFGFLADKFGRKRLVMIGFVMLGIGYAALAFLPIGYSSYIYVFADGVAWGIFSVIFLLTIWGDIAESKMSDKFYFAGVLPYIFSNFGSILFGQSLLSIPIDAIFSFASVFLFLAVLPIVFAPETLPENIMKAHDVNSYVGKAMEKAKKEAKNE
jgi:MFS family permease